MNYLSSIYKRVKFKIKPIYINELTRSPIYIRKPIFIYIRVFSFRLTKRLYIIYALLIIY